jgi:hypothetical protein
VDPGQVEFCANLSSGHKWSPNYVHPRQSSGNPTPDTPEPDRTPPDRPTACFIAQQDSSATIYSLHFNSLKEEFGVVSKIKFLFFIFF